MKKNYRWGIMGAGRIAEKFCTALHYTTGSEVYAVASRDIAKANDYAARFSAAKCYSQYTELLKDDKVDVIYIATPHAFHYEQVMECFRYGKAVLCEKPMSLTYRQTSEMIGAAEQNKLFLMEGMWTACMPFMDKIKELIKEGVIGNPQYVSANFGFAAPFDPEGRLFDKTLGGGSVMDVGVYTLYLATILLGEPSLVKTITKTGETGVDEYANISLQYAGGQTAQLLSAITFNTSIEAAVYGTAGSIHIRNPWFKATEIELEQNDGSKEVFSMPHESNGFEHEIREVMHCLDNGVLQSDKVPHSLTLAVSKIMEEVLLQAGIQY